MRINMRKPDNFFHWQDFDRRRDKASLLAVYGAGKNADYLVAVNKIEPTVLIDQQADAPLKRIGEASIPIVNLDTFILENSNTETDIIVSTTNPEYLCEIYQTLASSILANNEKTRIYFYHFFSFRTHQIVSHLKKVRINGITAIHGDIASELAAEKAAPGDYVWHVFPMEDEYRDYARLMAWCHLHPHCVRAFKKELSYIKKHKRLRVFNDTFMDKYENSSVDFHIDAGGRYFCIEDMFANRQKLYVTPNFSNLEAVSLLSEQDELSPHRYVDERIFSAIRTGELDTLVDVGAAEGNLSLSLAAGLKKIVLIEYESKWLRPLSSAFKPFKEKVSIVNKLVSESEPLDEILENVDLSRAIIKLDVEGAEISVLKSAHKTLSRAACLLVCTCHKQHDYEKISLFLQSAGYEILHSPGFMLFYFPGKYARNMFREPPFFRRGLIRACKAKF